jgi:calmodulin
MHEYVESSIASRTALHRLIDTSTFSSIFAGTTGSMQIGYLMRLQKRRRKYGYSYNNIAIAILVVVLLWRIDESSLSVMLPQVNAAAFVTTTTLTSRKLNTLQNTRRAVHHTHYRAASRTFHSMVLSDTTVSTTTDAMNPPPFSDLQLQPSDDGIYAITTPDEHTALMKFAEEHQKLVILKVFAPWCRACKGLESKFIQISRETEYAPSSTLPIIYASFTIQHNKAFVQSLGVLALPTIQFYVAGQLIDTFPCGPSKVPILRRKLTQLIQDHVDASMGTLKAGSMEQVAVLAEETAASIAAAAALKRQSSTTTTTATTSADADVMPKTQQTTTVVSSDENDDDIEGTAPIVITAQDRSVFERIPYFKGISLADFDEVLTKVLPLTFQPGSVIVREGKPGRTFYVIQRGEVEICQKTNQRSMSRNVESLLTSDPMVQPSVIGTTNSLYVGTVVNRLGPGDFFGERALITGEPRAASIRVAESGPVTVWAFDKDTFPFSCVLSGKSRNTGASTSNMEQVNTKYGVGLNATDISALDDTDEANLQQIIDEYQQHMLNKQMYDVSTASQIRGSIHKPQLIPDPDFETRMDTKRATTMPTSDDDRIPNFVPENPHDAIFSLLSRFQMIRHVSRCFRYIQESKTILKWGDVGSRTRRNMLVQRLSQSRQQEYQDIFHIMDINKDGCIEVDELQVLMDSIGEPLLVEESMLVGASDSVETAGTNSDVGTDIDSGSCMSEGGMTYEDFMGLMAEAEFYYLFRDIFASLDVEDSGYVKAYELDRVLRGVRDLISDDRKSIIDVEDKDMLIDYEQFSRMLLGTTLL